MSEYYKSADADRTHRLAKRGWERDWSTDTTIGNVDVSCICGWSAPPLRLLHKDFTNASSAVLDAHIQEAEKRAAEDAKVERLAEVYWNSTDSWDDWSEIGVPARNDIKRRIRAVLAALEAEQ